MTKNIAVIRGDGIGPEIVNQAIRVLDKVAEKYRHTFNYTDVDMGGCAIDKWGDPLPETELEKCKNSDSVLLGAVGGNKWNDVPGNMRPEKGLLRLRAGMEVYSNNRQTGRGFLQSAWHSCQPTCPKAPHRNNTFGSHDAQIQF